MIINCSNQNLLPKDDITEPSVTRDLFIFAPSFSRTPVAPVESARSLKINYLDDVLHLNLLPISPDSWKFSCQCRTGRLR